MAREGVRKKGKGVLQQGGTTRGGPGASILLSLPLFRVERAVWRSDASRSLRPSFRNAKMDEYFYQDGGGRADVGSSPHVSVKDDHHNVLYTNIKKQNSLYAFALYKIERQSEKVKKTNI